METSPKRSRTDDDDDMLDRIIEAHGGAALWRRCRLIRARLSSGGLALVSKLQGRALLDRMIALDPHAPRLIIDPFPEAGFTGEWTPEIVRVTNASGRIIQERHDPREAFRRLEKLIRWDVLDILYFGGYALWNYLSFPFFLTQRGVELRALDRKEAIPGCLTLCATFPENFPTHSREQRFHVERDSLLLRRHDYVADVIGPFASAANFCLAFDGVTGLRLYTKRRVYPRFGENLIAPFPTLVWVEFADLNVDMA